METSRKVGDAFNIYKQMLVQNGLNGISCVFTGINNYILLVLINFWVT